VEETLARLRCSTLLVTHDRGQAERLAQRVVELGR
jgi:ABC-type sulfate/molybdate transport systems ATPase subunit